MKNNKTMFMFPSILLFLLLAALPVFKILIDIKNVQSSFFSIVTIIYLLLIILLIIVVFIEELYLINYLFTKLKMNIYLKLLWAIMLLIFNILIIPYFYIKYVSKETKLFLKSLIYLIPIILFTFIFIYGFNTYITKANEIKEERKRIEEERNEFKTKDQKVSFTFRHGYKISEVGEYDLYVKNKSKNVIFTAFTYNTEDYEQKTADDFINKGIYDIAKDKEKFDIFKEKEILDEEDKTITTVEYVGKTNTSSKCVYKISVIIFKSNPNYLIYTVEVVTKNNYNLYKKEILEILKSAKLY